MKKIIVTLLILTLTLPFSSYAKNKWETQHEPLKGAPSSIGDHTNGCLIGAMKLPEDGYGYQAMRLSRNRNYGNPSMIRYIQKLARNVKDQLGRMLAVGDIGQPKGGPFSYGHQSHEIGLDADIWYWYPPVMHKRSLSRTEREKISAVNLVNNRKKEVHPFNWKPVYRDVLKIAASQPEVDRIFVNAAIKRQLCRTDKGAAWLGKIRPWWGHDYHFHVRLKCPANNPYCKLPEYTVGTESDGCSDSEIGWWFRKPTKAEILAWKKEEEYRKKHPRSKPQLPKQCKTIVGDK